VVVVVVAVQQLPQVRVFLVVLVVAVQAQGQQLTPALALVVHQVKVMLAGLEYLQPINPVVVEEALELLDFLVVLALTVRAEMAVLVLRLQLVGQ
jgi:hypothetical protein